MEVAVSCLAQYMQVSERLAEALVDGHCEKTLAFLWNVIFHFKVCLVPRCINCSCSHVLYCVVVHNVHYMYLRVCMYICVHVQHGFPFGHVCR